MSPIINSYHWFPKPMISSPNALRNLKVVGQRSKPVYHKEKKLQMLNTPKAF